PGSQIREHELDQAFGLLPLLLGFVTGIDGENKQCCQQDCRSDRCCNEPERAMELSLRIALDQRVKWHTGNPGNDLQSAEPHTVPLAAKISGDRFQNYAIGA